MYADAFLQHIQIVAAFEHGREPAADMARSIRIAEKRLIDLPDDCRDRNIETGIDIFPANLRAVDETSSLVGDKITIK